MQSYSNADAPAGPQEHFPDLAVARPALSERLRAEGSRSRALLLPRRAQEEHFNGATRGLASPQARRNDPRVVHDHDVGRLQVFGEIAKDAVLQPAGGSIDHEESRRITRLDRMLGDQVWGQRVIEVGEFHAKSTQSSQSAQSFSVSCNSQGRVDWVDWEDREDW